MDESTLSRYLPLINDPVAFWDSLHQPLPICFWVNPLKATPEQVLKALGIAAAPIGFVPHGYRVQQWVKPGATLAHFAGWYYLQEEIAMAAVAALSPQPGEAVLDLCAAPGGKTAQIALQVGSTGCVVANDFNASRLPQLTANIARLGLTNVMVYQQDGRRFPLPPHSFDRVLVDAPCSGEGRVRQRQRATQWQPHHSQRIARVQQRLLDRALALVKPGGVIVYSTCTFAPEENEAIIDAVVGPRGTLEPVSIPTLQATPGITAWQGQSFRPDLQQACRYFPHQNNTGGFFVARIRRTEVDLSTEPSTPSPPSPWLGQAPPVATQSPLDWFQKRYGVVPTALLPYQGWAKGKKTIWITDAATVSPAGGPPPQGIGLPLARRLSRSFKPTTAALQRFGPWIQNQIVELPNLQAAQAFIQGDCQDLPDQVASGFVHVRYGSYHLGCGFYKEHQLHSQIPKTLQVQSILSAPDQSDGLTGSPAKRMS